VGLESALAVALRLTINTLEYRGRAAFTN